MADRPNQGKQTELVKRALVNFINDHGLHAGDRMPTQAQLRVELGVGNAVIGRAVQTLVAEGVLNNLGRGGIKVRTPRTDGFEGRNIGLICHRNTEYSSMAVLMQALGIALNNHACRITLFIKEEEEQGEASALKEFRGAEIAVRQHLIDGLISTMLLTDESVAFCREMNIPLC